ncbi:hypothetical protein QG37_01112 [Candidozyma auris]|nr:hypothetical protein QG37_01112 [[Candida] auris]
MPHSCNSGNFLPPVSSTFRVRIHIFLSQGSLESVSRTWSKLAAIPQWSLKHSKLVLEVGVKHGSASKIVDPMHGLILMSLLSFQGLLKSSSCKRGFEHLAVPEFQKLSRYKVQGTRFQGSEQWRRFFADCATCVGIVELGI